jgi:peroxiredoxin
MANTRLLKNPFILVPLVAGTLLPCIAFVALHFLRHPASQSELVLKDAVVISGQPLPQTELLDLDGKNVQSDKLRKGKVMLVFLTTGCGACQKELTLLSRVDGEISDKVRVYGIGVENRDQIESFIQANEFKTKVLLDKDGKLMKSLSVKYFPTKFLLEDGVTRASGEIFDLLVSLSHIWFETQRQLSIGIAGT